MILVIIMSLTAFGCSKQQSLPLNSFYYENVIGSDGNITQNIAIPTLEKEIANQIGCVNFEKYERDLCSAVEENVFNKIYLNYWLKKLENGNTEEESVIFVKPYLNEERVVVTVKYFKSSNSTTSEKTDSDGIKFIEKQEVNKKFVFEETNNDGETLGEIYVDILKKVINNNFPDINFDLLDYSFEYRYTTPYSQIKSNADYKITSSSGYVHSWERRKGDVKSKNINLWVNKINTGWWYLFALLGTFVIGGIIFLIMFLKNKKKHRNI